MISYNEHIDKKSCLCLGADVQGQPYKNHADFSVPSQIFNLIFVAGLSAGLSAMSP